MTSTQLSFRAVFLLIALALVFRPQLVVAQRLGAEDAPPPEVHAFQLNHISSQFAVQSIANLFPELKRVRISADQRANRLLVVGSADDLEVMNAVLKELDVPDAAPAAETPAENLQIELYWMADVPEENADTGTAWELPPSHIRELVDAKLSKQLGLENPLLISRLYVQSLVGGKVHSPGAFQASGTGQGAINTTLKARPFDFQLMCKGKVYRGDDGTYDIDLEIDVVVGKIPSGIQTRIRTKPSHPVCLALARTSSMRSFFVIQVSEGD